MKKEFIIFLLLLLSLVSCVNLPEMIPSGNPNVRAGIVNTCRSVFPQKEMAFTHEIRATVPGGNALSVIGVTRIFPQKNRLECAIITIEGLVLFQAEWENGETHVERALRPFTNSEFARGLIEDIRLIFFFPDSEWIEAGTGRNGNIRCRCRDSERITDVTVDPDGKVEITRYAKNKRIKRKIRISYHDGFFLDETYRSPENIELIAFRPADYRLTMRRIE